LALDQGFGGRKNRALSGGIDRVCGEKGRINDVLTGY
jgi:hypothetical protein